MSLNEIYNEEFYKVHRDESLQSAHIIVPLILNTFTINSVIDIGCGVGAWLSVFEKNGVKEIKGFDVNDLPPESYYLKKNKIQTRCDLVSSEFVLNAKADLTICLEVAEHLPLEVSDNLIKNLTNSAPIIIFSAAFPGQTGVNHINEQPPWYWREKFNKINFFEMDFLRPLIWKDERIAWWYRQNTTSYIDSAYADTNVHIKHLFAKYGQKPGPHRLTLVNEWILQNMNRPPV
jgi:hypothetical protein